MIANNDFADAAEIADKIDWKRVRSISMLQRISNLYKINGRFEDALNIMLLAYDRKPEIKSIIYEICELYVELDDIAQAMKFLALFRKVAPGDTDDYILHYKILEKNEVKLEERIELLEEYCRKEKREEWIYQLAYLYHRIGFGTKCVETCDQLILWFREGPFVIKAMELKMLHGKLTPEQQEFYDHKDDEVVEELSEYESDEYEPYNPEAAYIPEMESEDFHVKTIDMGKFNTINLQKALAESMREILGDEYQEETADPSTTDEIMRPLLDTEEMEKVEQSEEVEEEITEETLVEVTPEDLVEETPANLEEVPGENDPSEHTGEVFFQDKTGDLFAEETIEPISEKLGVSEEVLHAETRPLENLSDLDVKHYAQIEELEDATAFVPSVASITTEELEEGLRLDEEPEEEKSLSEIIEEKKKQFTAPLPEIPEEDIKDSHYENIVMRDVTIPSASESALSSYENFVSMDTNGQISIVLPKEETPVERQITGQLDIEEIMNEWDALLLKKEEQHKESIKETIRRQTGRLFDEYDQATRNSLLYQIEAEAKAANKVFRGDVSLKGVDEVEEYTDLDEYEELSLPLVDAEESLETEKEKKDTQSIAAAVGAAVGVVAAGATAMTAEAGVIAAGAEAAVAGAVATGTEAVVSAVSEVVGDASETSIDGVSSETSEEEKEIVKEETSEENPEEISEEEVTEEVLETEVSEETEETIEKPSEEMVSEETSEEAVKESSEEKTPDDILKEVFTEEKEEKIEETIEEEISEEVTSEESLELSEEEYEEFSGEFEEYTGEFEEYNEEEFADEIAALEEQMEAEISEEEMESEESVENTEGEEAEPEEVSEKTSSVDTSAMKGIQNALMQDADEVSAQVVREMNDIPDEEDARELSPSELELFEDFLYSNKMKRQILDAVEQISLAPFVGNVLITGDNPSASIDLAKSLIKEIQVNDSNFVAQKVAKISGSKLNNKDIAATFSQLSGGALIVEKAGVLTKDTLSSMTRTLENFTGGIIILFMDTVKSINKLINKYPVLTGYFNARIDIMPMSETALIDYAKKYAYKKEYKIDEEKGVLALARRINELQLGDHHVTTMEVEEIVDEAIAHSKKPRLSTFVDILGGKRYDYEDMIVLREKDFE